MTVRPEVVEEVLDAIAERVALRLGAGAASPPAPAELWRLLKLEDVCERLGRSERTVRRWVKEGALPRVQLDGGALAFDLEDVKAFARARRVGEVDVAAPTDVSKERRLRAVDRGWDA